MASRSKAPATSETADPNNREASAQGVTEPVKSASDAPSTAPKGDPLATVGQDMPAVQPHAIAAEAKKAEDATAAQKALSTEFPGFDPALHEVGADGKPTRTKDGGYRRKRGGASAAQQGKRKLSGLQTPGDAGDRAQAAGEAQKAQAAKIDAAAKMATQLVIMGGSIAFGQEAAQPIKRTIAPGQELDERAGLDDAWRTYFTAKGITDFPPGIMVCVVCASYAIARYRMPQAQPHLTWWRSKVYGLVARWKAWRAGRKYIPENGPKKPEPAKPSTNGATVHAEVDAAGDRTTV